MGLARELGLVQKNAVALKPLPSLGHRQGFLVQKKASVPGRVEFAHSYFVNKALTKSSKWRYCIALSRGCFERHI